MGRLAAVLFPLCLVAQPHLFLDSDDLARISERATAEAWAAAARDAIVRVAENWPQSHLTRFGLKELALPPEGGQWTHWYVCPVHGNGLRYTAPNRHTCPVDSQTFSGWPFDQVIYSWRHSELAAAARDNALSFRLTGNRGHGEAAAWILKQYAAAYLGYPIHDKDNKVSRTGARAGAQTLDESVWLIPLAWAFDLLSGSDLLAGAERAEIESKFLRPAVEVIQRYDAGISNWQSWHNAAIGAVGFALGDTAMKDAAIDGKSGFRFQMQNSVAGEGFWYEGAWSYHYYALDPIMQLAAMAARNGTDLWADLNLRNLFSAPLRLAFADGSLPAFNDSNTLNIFDQARFYEHAFARYGDPLFGAVAARRARGRDALLFGAPSLPDGPAPAQASEVFTDSGFAVLRAPSGDHAVTLKFGPHGGGHGHYDKLGLVSFALGGILAVDPGTQPYAAPTHATWDKHTVAHNTVVIDESTQGEATGRLVWSEITDRYSAACASAGPAYKTAALVRTMFVTPEYALDLFSVASSDGSPRRIDWVYHNAGKLRTGAPTEPYDAFPRAYGYQHLSSTRAAQPAGDWQVTFDGGPTSPVTYSSVYASAAAVKGTFQHSTEQAAGGQFSGRMAYEFNGPGYLLYSTPVLSGLPATAPSGLRMMVHGDNSGHVLTLRFNDATDERFTMRHGPVDWTGWKEIQVGDPSGWTHFLGNNDGVIDAPIRTVSIQLDGAADGPAAGALFVDDITVLYPEDNHRVVATFELPIRNLRLWMLGEPSTTVVTGEGLGPDLTKPVPFVMARRTAPSTRFVTLLEPYAAQPAVTSFTREEDSTLVIRSGRFEDRIRFSDAGVMLYERR